VDDVLPEKNSTNLMNHLKFNHSTIHGDVIAADQAKRSGVGVKKILSSGKWSQKCAVRVWCFDCTKLFISITACVTIV
jgi:hypothetical protein